jgi:2-polyprenyl-3-methyl-5-hydroxy-6-metoxy-1,4-benzoquinol methylase
MNNKVKFILPPYGILYPTNEEDPLLFYYKPIVGSLYKKRIQNGLDLLTPPLGSVLDFGYGSGVLLPTLNSVSSELHAIDLNSSVDLVNNGLKKLNIKANLTKGDITNHFYKEKSFDLIIAFSVFEHIADPIPILKEMSKILKDNGYLLVGMPRVDSFMEKLFKLIGFSEINKHHVMNFDSFLKIAGNFFIVEKKSHIPSFLPPFLGLYFNILLKNKVLFH